MPKHWSKRTMIVVERTNYTPDAGVEVGYCRTCLADMTYSFGADSNLLRHYTSHEAARKRGLL